jgi:YVTN family beta-propeller protein
MSGRTASVLGLAAVLCSGGCGGGGSHARAPIAPPTQPITAALASQPPFRAYARPSGGNVYAADRRRGLAPAVRRVPPLVYVPNSGSNTVQEIDPGKYRVVREFGVDAEPQHVVPSYDLRTLWVTNDKGNSLTPIDPRTGAPGPPVHVDDPYNLYFTPDGRYAVVMAELLQRVDFRDAHTMQLHHSLSVPGCAGLNHADFTADGGYMLISCEFAAAMIVVDQSAERLVRTIQLPSGASPQDVKLSADGRIFYVADLKYGGVWEIDAATFQRVGFIATGPGAHGLYPSRDATRLYVSNRAAGSVSVISFAQRRVLATWTIGGSPDMGGVSVSGNVLWLSGRYDSSVYAINTKTGQLISRIPVGLGPHGLCVYPQPGRYSLGHTGVLR